VASKTGRGSCRRERGLESRGAAAKRAPMPGAASRRWCRRSATAAAPRPRRVPTPQREPRQDAGAAGSLLV